MPCKLSGEFAVRWVYACGDAPATSLVFLGILIDTKSGSPLISYPDYSF